MKRWNSFEAQLYTSFRRLYEYERRRILGWILKLDVQPKFESSNLNLGRETLPEVTVYEAGVSLVLSPSLGGQL
jgi:hypothetical protein